MRLDPEINHLVIDVGQDQRWHSCLINTLHHVYKSILDSRAIIPSVHVYRAPQAKMTRMPIHKSHGGFHVYAIPVGPCVVIYDGVFYENPVIVSAGFTRRNPKWQKKSEVIWRRLNWRFVSGCPHRVNGDCLLISCQGYTFELIDAHLE